MGLFRRSLELGLSALSMTTDVAEKLLKELTDEEGMDPARADAAVSEFKDEVACVRDQVTALVTQQVQQALSAAGMVSQADYDELAERVAQLEAEVAALKPKPDLSFEPTNDF